MISRQFKNALFSRRGEALVVGRLLECFYFNLGALTYSKPSYSSSCKWHCSTGMRQPPTHRDPRLDKHWRVTYNKGVGFGLGTELNAQSGGRTGGRLVMESLTKGGGVKGLGWGRKVACHRRLLSCSCTRERWYYEGYSYAARCLNPHRGRSC